VQRGEHGGVRDPLPRLRRHGPERRLTRPLAVLPEHRHQLSRGTRGQRIGPEVEPVRILGRLTYQPRRGQNQPAARIATPARPSQVTAARIATPAAPSQVTAARIATPAAPSQVTAVVTRLVGRQPVPALVVPERDGDLLVQLLQFGADPRMPHDFRAGRLPDFPDLAGQPRGIEFTAHHFVRLATMVTIRNHLSRLEHCQVPPLP
jgi:hypothetical protein